MKVKLPLATKTCRHEYRPSAIWGRSVLSLYRHYLLANRQLEFFAVFPPWGIASILTDRLYRNQQPKNCALLVYYAANSGNSLPTFRDNISALSLGQRRGPIGCPETSVRNYHCSLRNSPEERSSHLLRSGSLKSRKLQPVWTQGLKEEFVHAGNQTWIIQSLNHSQVSNGLKNSDYVISQ
jgi:hypothetical protein